MSANIEVVGVVGAGVIGRGVAQDLAERGLSVVLVDRTDDILRRALDEIARQVRFGGLFRKEKASAPPDAVLARIRPATDLAALREVQFAIENVTERLETKREVHERLDAVLPEACIIATNSSAIPVDRVAAAAPRRAPALLGMHFMNPVPLKKTVEVIRGSATADATVAAAIALLARLGKEAVVVRDSPGYVSNRILMLAVNEAAALVEEGVASAEDVDRIARECFGHKMGPLETADLIGLDTIVLTLEALSGSFGEAKYRPAPLLRRMVGEGRLGRKSGEGFFPYHGAGGGS